MVSDLSAIDQVVYTTLATDAALLALTPDGVHWDLAPSGARRFVVITQTDGDYTAALGNEDGLERITYDIKAVNNSASVAPTNDAAFRIHELLHRGLQSDVSAGNYLIMHCERIRPIRYGEPDPQNTAARWQHAGGQYQLTLCPSTT